MLLSFWRICRPHSCRRHRRSHRLRFCVCLGGQNCFWLFCFGKVCLQVKPSLLPASSAQPFFGSWCSMVSDTACCCLSVCCGCKGRGEREEEEKEIDDGYGGDNISWIDQWTADHMTLQRKRGWWWWWLWLSAYFFSLFCLFANDSCRLKRTMEARWAHTHTHCLAFLCRGCLWAPIFFITSVQFSLVISEASKVQAQADKACASVQALSALLVGWLVVCVQSVYCICSRLVQQTTTSLEIFLYAMQAFLLCFISWPLK